MHQLGELYIRREHVSAVSPVIADPAGGEDFIFTLHMIGGQDLHIRFSTEDAADHRFTKFCDTLGGD